MVLVILRHVAIHRTQHLLRASSHLWRHRFVTNDDAALHHSHHCGPQFAHISGLPKQARQRTSSCDNRFHFVRRALRQGHAVTPTRLEVWIDSGEVQPTHIPHVRQSYKVRRKTVGTKLQENCVDNAQRVDELLFVLDVDCHASDQAIQNCIGILLAQQKRHAKPWFGTHCLAAAAARRPHTTQTLLQHHMHCLRAKRATQAFPSGLWQQRSAPLRRLVELVRVRKDHTTTSLETIVTRRSDDIIQPISLLLERCSNNH